MILYYAVTSYHVLCCILHKLKYNKDQEAILFLSDTHPECEKLVQAVKSETVFVKVNTFPDKGRMLPLKKEYAKNETKENLTKLTNLLCAQMEKELPFEPSQIEEYNICGDQYALGLWLIQKGMEYNYFEEGCGVYTRSYLLLENLKRLNQFQHDVALHFQCMGKNKKIKSKFIEFASQEGAFDKEKCIDFSVKHMLTQLSKNELEQVLAIFQVPEKKQGDAGAVLLLTQQFVNMGFLSVAQEKELYDLMLDIFAMKGNLYVKPHPSDWQGLYEKWYPEATVFQRFMPSELLPYAVNGKFEQGITVSSTSIFGLEPYLEKVVCLDSSFEDAYPQLIKYDVVGQLLKELENITITYQGKYQRLFDEVKSEGYSGTYQVVVTDTCEMIQGDCIIYLNPDNRDELTKEWMDESENIIPIPIEVVDVDSQMETVEYMYCLCQNQELAKQIENLEVYHMLERSKKEIVVDKEYYKRKCLALEGMLRVTNQRVEALLQEKQNNRK